MLPRMTKARVLSLLTVLFFGGFAFGLSINYRSIGVNADILYQYGNASIDIGTTTVTFGGGASLPAPTVVGAVGPGDELVIGAETFYILSRDDATHVTVQTAAASTHTNESFEIRRAYNDIQTWEDARDGNLTSNDYREVGVCYKDDVFMPTARIEINDSTTDATRYMLLTVAPGQQHSGTAGTGVVVDGTNIATSHLFWVRDTYFRMELLEIRNYDGDTVNGQPINLDEGDAGNNLLSKLIIHDYTSTGRGAINVYENATVRNCIIYNGDKGIRSYSNANLTLTIENVTIYSMTGTGVHHDKGKLIVKNTISVGTNRDFDLDNDDPVDASSGYNMYSTVHNDIHPGTSSGLISISFDGPTKKITRTTGSFLTDGFVIGNIINTDSGANPGPFTIANVTALEITVSEPVTTQAASSRNVYLDLNSVIKESPPASLDDLFISTTPSSENLHIKSSGHDALDNGQDLSGSFTDDIDGGSRPQGAGWDIGADESGATFVDLISFTATGQSDSVLLEWATATELDNAGFNLWRSEEKNGEYVRINPYFIPAEGQAGFGAEYSFTDYNVQNGRVYYYKLEDIDIYGNTSFHGPVPATPNDIIPIWPDEGKIIPSGAILFSWASAENYYFKIEISANPSFSASETITFPEEGWITTNSLWLRPEEWEMALNTARESEGRLFWRIRARSEDGRVVYSNWKRFLFEGPKFSKE